MSSNHETESMEHRFMYHSPRDASVAGQHSEVRAGAFELAREWDAVLPPCRETSLAITKLEEAMFWANAAIARHCNE